MPLASVELLTGAEKRCLVGATPPAARTSKCAWGAAPERQPFLYTWRSWRGTERYPCGLFVRFCRALTGLADSELLFRASPAPPRNPFSPFPDLFHLPPPRPAPSHPLRSFNCLDSFPLFLPFLPFPHSYLHLGLPSPVGRPPSLFSSALPFLHPSSILVSLFLSALLFSPLPLLLFLSSLSPNADLQPRSWVPASRRRHRRGCRQLEAAGTAPRAPVTRPGGNRPRLCSRLGLLPTDTECAHTLPQTVL